MKLGLMTIIAGSVAFMSCPASAQTVTITGTGTLGTIGYFGASGLTLKSQTGLPDNATVDFTLSTDASHLVAFNGYQSQYLTDYLSVTINGSPELNQFSDLTGYVVVTNDGLTDYLAVSISGDYASSSTLYGSQFNFSGFIQYTDNPFNSSALPTTNPSALNAVTEANFSLQHRDDSSGVYSNRPGSHLMITAISGGTVPEPATWALMLLGFGGMAVSLRRRFPTRVPTSI